MRRVLEQVPGLFMGRPWSRLIPWRLHLSFERHASQRLYRQEPPPSLRLRTGSGEASLLFAGDLALHRWSASAPPDSAFEGVRQEFDRADFATANLETVLTTSDEAGGKIGAFLKGPPAGVECLKYLGIDAVTSANNHALDFGEAGLAQCGTILRQNGIGWFGVDDGGAPDGVPGALVTKVKGITVGMLAATDHFGGFGAATCPSPVWFDRSSLEAGIRALRSRCDIVVVQLHWGYEFVMYPLRWHRDLARTLVDLGADIVCCHHAHVVMGVESWGRGVIAHGLGNFFFGAGGHSHPLRRFGLLLRVSVDRGGPISADVVPVITDSGGRVRLEKDPCRGYHRLCEGLADDAFLGKVETARVFHELAQIADGHRTLTDRKDVEGLLERQAALRGPRQEWLLKRAEESELPTWRSFGRWLSAFRSLPEEAVRRMAIRPIPEFGDLLGSLDPRLLPGRLP